MTLRGLRALLMRVTVHHGPHPTLIACWGKHANMACTVGAWQNRHGSAICSRVQARCTELLAARDRARRQLDSDRLAWADEQSVLKSRAASLQVPAGSVSAALPVPFPGQQVSPGQAQQVRALNSQHEVCKATSLLRCLSVCCLTQRDLEVENLQADLENAKARADQQLADSKQSAAAARAAAKRDTAAELDQLRSESAAAIRNSNLLMEVKPSRG